MKMKTYKRMLFTVALVSIFAQCKKNDSPAVEDPHNHSLLNKSLPEIKSEIAGHWVEKYTFLCGIIGSCIHPAQPNSYIDFIPVDTLKRIQNGVIFEYGKMYIHKEANVNWGYGGSDSVYVFKLQGSPYAYVMQEIRNDTLVINGDGIKFYIR